MSRGKIAVLLLVVLVLSLSVAGCAGLTSQGPQEQKRPAESQETPGEEEITEATMHNPAKAMEKTGKGEAGEKTEEQEKGASP